MKYVVAVSGGVDSMVLLHQLVNGVCEGLSVAPHNIIVAHFEHGIRDDSPEDEKLVRRVAQQYGLTYESASGKLGISASEAHARKVRYNFLRQCCIKYKAQLVTAHHQDDLIETMIINLIRGTGWRGLVSLDSSFQILRPLLAQSKHAILRYAHAHSLEWREDSTNNNEAYTRNYVRLRLIPAMQRKDPEFLETFLELHSKTYLVKSKIATELQKYITNYRQTDCSYIAPRYNIIMLPRLVAHEVVYTILVRLDPDWHPSTRQIHSLLNFIKTGRPHKIFELNKQVKITLTQQKVQFKKG